MIALPRLYAILDGSRFLDFEAALRAAKEWMAAGVTLIQYRNKSGDVSRVMAEARQLRENSMRTGVPTVHNLIMNDRPDLCLAAGFDGVHLGQDDLLPESARRILGSRRWIGVSTHNPEQVSQADRISADYVAIGPVFGTSSKVNPDPVVGLEGVRQARLLTRKPLAAIGGITRENCRSVIDAGADSVAVISDLIMAPGKSAEEFLRILG
jgi:thiamine-phosphate pyrophosphorylase